MDTTMKKLIGQSRILLVDDDEDVRENSEEILKVLTPNITLAESGQAALDCLAKEKFDLLITDLRMPEMSGLDLLFKIKDQGRVHGAMLMTAFADEAVLAKSIDLEVMSFLDKPSLPEDMIKAVRKSLEKVIQMKCQLKVIEIMIDSIQIPVKENFDSMNAEERTLTLYKLAQILRMKTTNEKSREKKQKAG